MWDYLMPDDVTVTGWVLRETPSGLAIIFLWDQRRLGKDVVILPKSQIKITLGQMVDEVILPRWLAFQKGLI
jgi:hypothetical protein